MTLYKKTFMLGDTEATMEFGEIGRQAGATVIVSMNDTVVMVAATGSREAMPNAGFLPLTVDYQEKYYAAGRIPGGFLRREGRPSEKEVLTSRLIDRSIRPLFPDFFYHETQVIANVLSYNPEVNSDILAMIGTSAALRLSGIPFNGPIGAVRVGFSNNAPIINPTQSQIENSELDLVVAGSRQGVLMVESEAKQLSEAVMLNAIMQGHSAIQASIDAIEHLAQEAGKPAWDWQAPALNDEQKNSLRTATNQAFDDAYNITEKQARSNRLAEIRKSGTEAVLTESSTPLEGNLVNSELKKIEASIVRERILSGQPRIDGRGTRTVRPIAIRLGVLPRTHGSALFTRGETQALVVTTLGSTRDEQKIDALQGEQFDSFMMHYNMPPYATGETGRNIGPKRREVGHGRLAKRGLAAVMPSKEDFEFPLRVVSEITESNGSSSMASVCGGSLSMMDASVPLSAHVSGIAMGLIKENDRFAVLTDILGDEDHLGDMDFKVAGTRKGVTALQMDIKIDSINEQIMQAALEQANEGRLHILGLMEEALPGPREDASPYAPRMLKVKIPKNKIRDVIGKGGSVIRNLTETTETRIDVNDDGMVTISGRNLEVCENAKEQIENLTKDVEIGAIYDGKVENILENVGAVVSILPGRDGLLHISQISNDRINKVSDVLSLNQSVRVKVLRADDGRVRFTMLNLDEAPPVSKEQDAE
ncbi:polyribonucleotide nucleotidyltransferase [Candidatus Persebacteraceae bacterium Df01]|jgi:polyribonucleotide nucleotidyltransferase|uniref:Polyribonucleotide nucleotidyltransferase n=1 Tax=Candidatus Doriopsillibacter californiensis TaxID=2970740 RepID=A0ABT7QMF4_9GAMM|nr:polyribonucleotide nucleotidyltransferase [Candidatus Persebacteraceae bacterium Df01]